MSFAVMSFYKYISKRLYDPLSIYTVYTNHKLKMEMYRGVSTPPPPPCRLQCLTIRRTFNCKVFTACKNKRNLFEVLLKCTHINNNIVN